MVDDKIKEKYLKKFKEIAEIKDVEIGHGEADRTIIQFLFEIECNELAVAYSKVPKWFA